jgi:hypothetical protein
MSERCLTIPFRKLLEENLDGYLDYQMGRLCHCGQAITAPGSLRDVVIADNQDVVKKVQFRLIHEHGEG